MLLKEYEKHATGLDSCFVRQQVPRKKRSVESIVQEFHTARLEAIHAKERGDKKGQEQASRTIRKIKQEISSLG